MLLTFSSLIDHHCFTNATFSEVSRFHLEGQTAFGDNIEDEWFIVAIVYNITRSIMTDDLMMMWHSGHILLMMMMMAMAMVTTMMMMLREHIPYECCHLTQSTHHIGAFRTL